MDESKLRSSFKIVSRQLKKGLQKKCRHTDTHTEKIRPDREVAGTRFWTSETALLLQVASKSVAKTNSQILLTTRLKSTSGFFVRCTLLKMRLRRNNFDVRIHGVHNSRWHAFDMADNMLKRASPAKTPAGLRSATATTAR